MVDGITSFRRRKALAKKHYRALRSEELSQTGRLYNVLFN